MRGAIIKAVALLLIIALSASACAGARDIAFLRVEPAILQLASHAMEQFINAITIGLVLLTGCARADSSGMCIDRGAVKEKFDAQGASLVTLTPEQCEFRHGKGRDLGFERLEPIGLDGQVHALALNLRRLRESALDFAQLRFEGVEPGVRALPLALSM